MRSFINALIYYYVYILYYFLNLNALIMLLEQHL